jgi:nucleotidyltransferase/DNA polymerase involved in DNA repair
VADLLTEPTRIADLQPSAIPSLLCQLSALQIALAGRLFAVGSDDDERTTTAEPDRLLTADDAAAILGVTTKWLYRHKKLPFVRRLSRKALRVSESGLHRWLAAKGHDTSARLR